VDSSVGGKTAVDLDGYKNMIGAFHQPRTVLIDPAVLLTLPIRQVANGLAEALKMGITSDAVLFAMLEALPVLSGVAPEQLLSEMADGEMLDCLTQIIARAVTVKRDVVQSDEKEAGLRRVLNFGHTLGHAIESCVGLGDLYHGECVAMGIPPMCGEEIRPRVVAVLQRLGLLTVPPRALSAERLIVAMKHDKKAEQGIINAVRCDEIGTFVFERVTSEELIARFDL
jgi:3-dehydroquinate synthase